MSDVVVPEEFADCSCLGGVVLDDEQALPMRPLHYSLMRVKARLQAVRGRRFVDEGERAAREPVLAVLVEGDDLDRNVPASPDPASAG
jgi:hypothetical protein